MFEVNVLRVGGGARSGDAIMLRFTDPETGDEARAIIDAGYQDDGERLVELFTGFYGTDKVDVAILSHPDGDHIGGMGPVVRRLHVGTLAVHRPSQHGGAALAASRAVEDLIEVAQANGVTRFVEPFAGVGGFGGALLVSGPSVEFYEALIREQVRTEGAVARTAAAGVVTRTMQRLAARVLPMLPAEIPFDDAGGDNPRNNSGTIIDLRVEGTRILFASDTGVPALNLAIDYLEVQGRTDLPIEYLQVPHHGSRHNMDSATLDRLLGRPTEAREGWAFVSISEQAAQDPRYPSPRVANGCLRRRHPVALTDNGDLQISSPDVPLRPGYSPVQPLPPLDESIDDR